MDIGKRLKNARELVGESQTQVSKYTGINNKTLSRYERTVSEPDLKTLRLLANYYKVSIEYLLGNSNDPYNNDIETMAVHGDAEEYTEEELKKIEYFKEFIIFKRENKDNKND